MLSIKNMKKVILICSLIVIIACQKDDDFGKSVLYKLKGEKVWSKTFGGSNDETIKSVITTKDGGFLVIGYTKSSDGDVIDASDNIEDAWLSKYNSEGDLLWSKTYGGSLDDYSYSAVELENGDFVVAGYTKSVDGDVSSNLGMHDFFVFKIDFNGNLIWSKTYGYTSHDHAHKIIKTTDNGFFVVGFTDYSGGIGNKNILHGFGEFYGMKLDSNGNMIWDVFFGGTQNDRVFDVVEANDGGYVMVGYSESNDFDATDNHGSYDYWVIKVNSTGDLIWKKSFGGSDLDQAYGISKTRNGNYLIVGTSSSLDGDISSHKGGNDIWVLAINDMGQKIWDKSFGGLQYETANSIKKIHDESFVIVGHTRSNDGDVFNNIGQNDFWVLNIDSGGKLFWEKTFGGTSFDFAYDCTQLLDDNLIIVGETQSSDFDAEVNKGMNDLLIVKIK